MVQVIKLGGSVLTHKESDEPRLRQDVLDRLAAEIAASDQEVVVVHGAGSFGHPLAEAHGLVEGIGTAEEVQAAAQVHADVRRLDLAVLDALRTAGLSPVAFPPFGVLGCNDGKAGSWNLVPLHRCFGLGMTPVTFGDIVLDTARGATVISGDQLMVEITRFLRPKRAIFALDEDGIYTAPPSAEPGGERLTEPSLAELEAAIGEGGKAKGTDVTGGMAGKIEATRMLVRYTDEVAFVNGTKEGRLAAALEGQVEGTLVRPEVGP